MDLKKQLLKLLDDDQIQAKLCLIINSKPIATNQGSLSETSCDCSSNIESLASQEFNTMQVQFDASEQRIRQLVSENQQLNQLIEKIKHLLGFSQDADLDLPDTISQLQQQLQAKEVEINQLNQVVDTQKAQLQERKQDSSKRDEKLVWYQTHFEDDLTIFNLYQELSEQTRTSLNGIFKDCSIQGIVACGIQEKNISNFWDYAKSEVINGTNPDLGKINRLFELLFKRFNLAYPMFSLQSVSIGDSFDTQLHIKHNSSVNNTGVISKILLTGYVNTKNQKVIKSSVIVI
ncbi:hypothetical protein [Vibrio cholerae]|uniref:hypothetical protein n=1 Tax=Vibrio cholerae TaxID=666 RepID=UPI000E09FB93|nr:hypothetical protein [Vibrio cholerae]GHW65519.1 hypothetical protein VCSRO103_1689 [Vibrio cholerae]HDZ9290317.1 hypothetical protein [Vibrio cholerae]